MYVFLNDFMLQFADSLCLKQLVLSRNAVEEHIKRHLLSVTRQSFSFLETTQQTRLIHTINDSFSQFVRPQRCEFLGCLIFLFCIQNFV